MWKTTIAIEIENEMDNFKVKTQSHKLNRKTTKIGAWNIRSNKYEQEGIRARSRI